MARFTNPISGTVVRCEGDLAAYHLSLGWVDADAPTKPAAATTGKPKASPRTQRKTTK